MRSALKLNDLKSFLDEKVIQYNQPGFIELDPICIPHNYKKREDIEIAGFFAAMLAWGQRPTIIRKCRELLEMMENEPHRFIMEHSENDLKPFIGFKHRTFNATDTLYFIEALRHLYLKYGSLENVFISDQKEVSVETGLISFHHHFFELEEAPHRTRKHVSTPERGSTCKRLNMFLRWMVRKDSSGVDFGIWKKMSPSHLICPCDVHVDRVARKLNLIRRKQTDWLTALELTAKLRQLDPLDPVKYDFALFGLGIHEGFVPKIIRRG